MSLEKKTCQKCKKQKLLTDFYKMKTPTEENPDGLLPICKHCLEHSFKAAEPATFMPVLKVLNLPWVPSEYKAVYLKYVSANKPNSLSILGKYIMKMKLNQYSDYDFFTSQEAQEKYESKENYDSIENYNYDIPLTELSSLLTKKNNKKSSLIGDNDKPERNAADLLEAPGEETVSCSEFELTKEEMSYLILKWGRLFSADQLISLERQYLEMCQDFDIRNSSQRNYLKKMCIISMRYDEALLSNDFESAKKLSAMYTNINKEAGFQPIQNKTTDDNYLNSASYLVKLAESEGAIPVYNIDENPDLVDTTIKDFKLWVRNLISDDETITERFDVAKQELLEQDEKLKQKDYGEEDELEEGFGIDLSVYSDLDAVDQVEQEELNNGRNDY